MSKLTVGNFAFHRTVVTCRRNNTVGECLERMQERGIRHLVVVDSWGVLMGVITDRDIKKFVSPFAGSAVATERDNATLNAPIGSLMTKAPIYVLESTSLREAVTMFLQRHVGCLPVCDRRMMVIGIITRSDFMRFLLGYMEE